MLVFDDSGSLKSRNLHGPGVDQLLAEEHVANGAVTGVYWSLADNLGTIRDVVTLSDNGTPNDPADDFTTLVNHLIYDSFGQITHQTNPAYTPRQTYTGREYDADTKLYYYRARWYDPRTGQFLSPDPLGFAAGDANLSRYVGNNPLASGDPSGLQPDSVTAAFRHCAACGNSRAIYECMRDFLADRGDDAAAGSAKFVLERYKAISDEIDDVNRLAGDLVNARNVANNAAGVQAAETRLLGAVEKLKAKLSREQWTGRGGILGDASSTAKQRSETNLGKIEAELYRELQRGFPNAKGQNVEELLRSATTIASRPPIAPNIPQPLPQSLIKAAAEARQKVKPGGLKDFSPPQGSGRSAGHARSSHGFKDVNDPTILEIRNNPDRIYVGVNDNGNKVVIFWKDDTVVITDAADTTSVITAYGKNAPGRTNNLSAPRSDIWASMTNYFRVN